jgi:uncharacterized protein YqfA (UPF0365 family)
MNPWAMLAQQSPPSDEVFFVAVILFLIVFLTIVAVLFQFVGLYIRARVSGAPVTLAELMGMRLRKIKPRVIINARIQALHAGLDISISQMESHVLAGGDLQNVVNAMIVATRANIDLSWKTATATDLMGRDVLKEVQKQIPPPGPLHARPRSP